MNYVYEYKTDTLTDWYAADNKRQAAQEVVRVREPLDSLQEIEKKLRRLTRKEETEKYVIDFEDYDDEAGTEDKTRWCGYKIILTMKKAKNECKFPDIIATTEY